MSSPARSWAWAHGSGSPPCAGASPATWSPPGSLLGRSPPCWRQSSAPCCWDSDCANVRGGQSMLVRIHGEIVRAALSGVLAPEALRVTISANTFCDLYQWAPERHFDNGRDIAALGQLWRRGLHAYLTCAVECCAPTITQGH